MVRVPVSLEKLAWERETDTVSWKAPGKGPHKGKERYFTSLDFIAQVTLHILEKGKHPVRRYGGVRQNNGTDGTILPRPRKQKQGKRSQ